MPPRTTFLSFALPSITQAELDAVAETLRSGWMTTGPRTKEFERQFSLLTGMPHAVALNSGTAALHLSLAGLLDLKPGDEVIVPAYTFAATAEVVVYFGATLVLADSVPGGFNVDPASVASKITPRTRAIIPVHFGGEPADMDAIMSLARPRGIKVIEDAAHAPPTFYKGRPAGALGDAAAFSFYATKTLATGEGGMLVTFDETLERRARQLSLHGISRDAWKRYTQAGTWRYDIEDAGYKYNMSDIMASLGLVQLARMNELHLRRSVIAKSYDEAFGPTGLFELPPRDSANMNSWHLYPLRLRLERLGITRDAFIEQLKAANIGTSVHFIPLHLHSFYQKRLGHRPEEFPNALRAFESEISLPIYPGMSEADVQDVIAAVLDIAQRHRAG